MHFSRKTSEFFSGYVFFVFQTLGWKVLPLPKKNLLEKYKKFFQDKAFLGLVLEKVHQVATVFTTNVVI